jgi:hypothetical protein
MDASSTLPPSRRSPGDHVVEHHDDAERRMRDHQREEAQIDTEDGTEGVVQRDPGHDPG